MGNEPTVEIQTKPVASEIRAEFNAYEYSDHLELLAWKANQEKGMPKECLDDLEIALPQAEFLGKCTKKKDVMHVKARRPIKNIIRRSCVYPVRFDFILKKVKGTTEINNMRSIYHAHVIQVRKSY